MFDKKIIKLSNKRNTEKRNHCYVNKSCHIYLQIMHNTEVTISFYKMTGEKHDALIHCVQRNYHQVKSHI